MEPATSESNNHSSSVDTQDSKVPRQNRQLAVISISLFILFSISAVAFLYNQNQKLKNMLVNYQKTTTPSPEAIVNPTENWETYSNTTLGFEFKYPNGWKIQPDCKFGNVCFASPDFKPKQYAVGDGDGFYIAGSGNLFSVSTLAKTLAMNLENYCHPGGSLTIDSCEDIKLENWQAKKRVEKTQDKEEYATSIGVLTDKLFIAISLNYDTQLGKEVLGQILETFRFLKNNSTPKSISCTLEAKICPDGSSVGRTGPNCEFAPCPIVN